MVWTLIPNPESSMDHDPSHSVVNEITLIRDTKSGYNDQDTIMLFKEYVKMEMVEAAARMYMGGNIKMMITKDLIYWDTHWPKPFRLEPAFLRNKPIALTVYCLQSTVAVLFHEVINSMRLFRHPKFSQAFRVPTIQDAE